MSTIIFKEQTMITYTKFLTLKGSYYIKEYDGGKKDKKQTRPVLESTVIKNFKSEDVTIIIDNIETGNKVTVTSDDDSEKIKQYLGSKFV